MSVGFRPLAGQTMRGMLATGGRCGAKGCGARGWIGDAWLGYTGQYPPLSIKTVAERGKVQGYMVDARSGNAGGVTGIGRGRPHQFPRGGMEGIGRGRPHQFPRGGMEGMRGFAAGGGADFDWGSFWQGQLAGVLDAARDKWLTPRQGDTPPVIIVQQPAPAPAPKAGASSGLPKWAVPAAIGGGLLLLAFAGGRRH